jgi:hypothetical protein
VNPFWRGFWWTLFFGALMVWMAVSLVALIDWFERR